MVKETTRDRESSTKKKRKVTVSEAETDVDVYKKTINFEEKEALNRSVDTDAKMYIDNCQEIRKLLIEIFQLKSQDNSKMKEKLKQKCREACVRMVALKKLNRLDKVRLVKAKEGLAIEKQKVDSINLQYQNLLYEARYLILEFEKCSQFKSKDENIELITIEKFMKEAPAAVTSKFEDMKENDEEKKHELRIARLEYELDQRKNLTNLCKTLEEEKKKIDEEIIEYKKKLAGLAPKLNAVLEASKPLQEHLNLPIDKTRAEHELAYLLPEPLYLFYVNADGFKEVYDNSMKIAIIGDQEEAAQWREQQLSTNIQDEEDSEPETDVEEIVEVKKRRHRKSVGKIQDPKEEKKKRVLQPHPLTVDVTISIETISVILKLNYYYNFKIITVKSDVTIPSNINGETAREILMGETLLGELIQGDTGLESPNSTTSYLLKKYSLGSYESLIPEIGYAYGWAQKMCGLEFLTQSFTRKQAQNLSLTNVESVMKAIKRKLKLRFALAKQFEDLEKNQIPNIPETVDVPKNMVSRLTKWCSKNYQQFCQSSGVQNLINEELVNQNDTFYYATITRNNATMDCFIVIKNDFPTNPPIFCLTINYDGKYHAENCDDIRDMERSLNIEWPENNTVAEWILAAQITFACCYFDIYLETKYSNIFQQTSMYFRDVCARNRRRPFHFRKIGTGVYTQY